MHMYIAFHIGEIPEVSFWDTHYNRTVCNKIQIEDVNELIKY